MSRNFKDIVAEALDLPLTARAELASELLDSLDDLSEDENEQLSVEEAERRFAEYRTGATLRLLRRRGLRATRSRKK